MGWRTSSGTADFLEGVTKGYGVCVKGLELTLVVGDVAGEGAGGSWSPRATGVSEPLSAPLVRLPFLPPPSLTFSHRAPRPISYLSLRFHLASSSVSIFL